MHRKFEPVMSGGVPSSLPRANAEIVVDSNRVLRNTYWLLALSMLPTIAGAFAGANSWHKSPLLAQILRNFIGVEDDGNIEK